MKVLHVPLLAFLCTLDMCCLNISYSPNMILGTFYLTLSFFFFAIWEQSKINFNMQFLWYLSIYIMNSTATRCKTRTARVAQWLTRQTSTWSFFSESEDCGFDSHRGCFLFSIGNLFLYLSFLLLNSKKPARHINAYRYWPLVKRMVARTSVGITIRDFHSEYGPDSITVVSVRWSLYDLIA